MSHLMLFEAAYSMAVLPLTKSNLEYSDKAVATPENAEQVQSRSDPSNTQVSSLYRDA